MLLLFAFVWPARELPDISAILALNSKTAISRQPLRQTARFLAQHFRIASRQSIGIFPRCFKSPPPQTRCSASKFYPCHQNSILRGMAAPIVDRLRNLALYNTASSPDSLLLRKSNRCVVVVITTHILADCLHSVFLHSCRSLHVAIQRVACLPIGCYECSRLTHAHRTPTVSHNAAVRLVFHTSHSSSSPSFFYPHISHCSSSLPPSICRIQPLLHVS